MAKTGQDQYLKLSPQSHILFYKVLFDKEQPPSKYLLWQELLKCPQTLIFFLISPFSKFGTESCTSQEEGGSEVWRVFKNSKSSPKVKTLKLYGPFLWVGFNCLRATEPVWGDFYHFFVPFSSQEFLVLIWSTSKRWKAVISVSDYCQYALGWLKIDLKPKEKD